LRVGALGVVLALAYVVYQLSGSGWDPSLFAAFGEDDIPTRTFAEERLGEVILRPQFGHDGRLFFVQANDPWVLSPDTHAEILDRPLYRSQRMLYPLVTGGFGLLQPESIIWAMIVVNVLLLGFGTWSVAEIAVNLGGSPWWGLSFLLNLGFASELNVGGAGILAGALAFFAVAMLLEDRISVAVLALTLAALSREVMLIAAAGSGLWLWSKGRRREALLTGMVPLAAVVAWAVYLRARIDTLPSLDQVEDSLGLPLVGVVEAFRSWLNDPLDMLAGVATLLLLAVFAWRVARDRSLVGLAFIGFVPLALLLTEPVWHSYFDVTRAIAPVVTSFVLLAFAVRAEERTPSSPAR
jgi:hypothetical protein